MVFRRFLKTIESEEIHFKFLGVSRRKNNKKQDKIARIKTSMDALSTWPCAICA